LLFESVEVGLSKVSEKKRSYTREEKKRGLQVSMGNTLLMKFGGCTAEPFFLTFLPVEKSTPNPSFDSLLKLEP